MFINNELKKILNIKNIRNSYVVSSVKYLFRVVRAFRKYGIIQTIKKIIEIVKFKVSNLKIRKSNKECKQELDEILRGKEKMQIILFLSLSDWNIPLHQRPQQIAKALSKQGYLYFYCTRNSRYDNIDGFKKIEENCYVTNKFEMVCNINAKKIIHIYAGEINPIDHIIDEQILKGNIILYEYVDEIHENIFGSIPKYVFDRHDRLIKDENVLAVVTASKLYKEILQYRSKNCSLVTNGVDYEHFNRKFSLKEAPKELVHIISSSKPIIGYFGALAQWFDYDLIENIAKTRPEYEILLVGWDFDGSMVKSNISKYKNITVIGPINYNELPQYAYWFDVSTIPFKVNEITESTSPVKLFEYMALGHPIVTTNMPECKKYKSVLIGENVDDFIKKIDQALTLKDNEDYRECLKKEALDNTWDKKAEEIKKIIISYENSENSN